ncbi:MAG: hypothetical protein AAB766_00385 [Patescibacteria group bacterium]
MVEVFNTDNGMDNGQTDENNKPEFIPPTAGLNTENSDNQSETYYDYKKNRQKQQIAVAGLAIVGAGILIMGFIQIKNIIQIPWPVSKTEPGQAVAQTSKKEVAVDLKNEDPKKLKTQDTDEDGLSDFDEVYIYETSAYLADSDSDGVNDIDEIKNSEDPTCPIGVKCFATASGTSETSKTLNQTLRDGSGQASETSETSEVEMTDLTNLSASDLRALLLKSGKVNADQLKLVDDQTLLDMYKKMIAENPDMAKAIQTKKPTDSSVSAPANKAEAVAQLKNISIDEIKKSLIDQGADPELLKQVDDATLKNLYLEALDKASASVK